MTDTHAKIRAKGLDATGVTEQIADQMYRSKGARYMAIVEIKVDETHENAEGKRKVDLILEQVEPATDTTLDEHLRNLTRTLHYNRQVAIGEEPTLDSMDAVEPTVEAVIAANPSVLPHPFMTGMLGITDTEAGPVCDVAGCGKVEADRIHHMPATDPFTVNEDEEGDAPFVPDDEDDPYDDVHDFNQGPDDVCICGRSFEDEIHPDSDPDGAA